MTTIAIRAAIAIEIGITNDLNARLTMVSWMKISPVAYATDDRASEAKTGKARIFGSRVCSSWWLVNARPTSSRLSIDGAAVVDIEADATTGRLRHGWRSTGTRRPVRSGSAWGRSPDRPACAATRERTHAGSGSPPRTRDPRPSARATDA